ncbi:stress response translation initiation inhibitor YciH [Xylophilus rhododendri]|uniref:Stress response translation initiation inhibitor YciH n=1 Tax=Xylophilus rhododendri TaxID=2697032 RepID=A0A857J4A8_9BURK|nr:stress response translation initiation inhibitor YciH [Xylophilus rhododendri]QHI98790.1 stress response translation initiation inhibitor YciH [Xylophilus rhododendri]
MALVYSTEAGRVCPDCRQPMAGCTCRQQAQEQARRGDGTVRLAYETKGRGGKGVTVLRGLALDPEEIAKLGKTLRSACGAGGAVKDGGTLEIQGDHRDTVSRLLEQRGIAFKRTGG